MTTSSYGFSLAKTGWFSPLDIHFKNCTDGLPSSARTEVMLSYDDDYFHIRFNCLDDAFVNENNMVKHNEPLFNQEVFELFISPGAEDSKRYLEIEINPNNALWTGFILNPSLGESGISLEKMVEYEDAKIITQIAKTENSWSGGLSIPWDLIGRDRNGEYRLNFYRIVLKEKQKAADWKCDAKNCDFICWSPTMSKEPAFHRPKMFGKMNLV